MTERTADPSADTAFAVIRRITADVAKTRPQDIRLDSPVTGLVNVDSIVLLEIVALVELELGIEIAEEDLFDNLETVGDFVAVCHRLTTTTT
ncbi:MAG: acyl carrier protein [Catenulispora sp.]